ncbi:MAG: sulfurtransferase TusA family protein [Gammaproteobacteria bacterium]|nr:sulfurtransferase TusA family protein [Gammaproteobacteria bacterium]
MLEFQHELDARDDSCPGPVIKTKQRLLSMSSGEVLHVMATDPNSAEDIGLLLATLHDELVQSNEQDSVFHFYIRKK